MWVHGQAGWVVEYQALVIASWLVMGVAQPGLAPAHLLVLILLA